MTNKEKTIKAIDEIIYNFKYPDNKPFGNFYHCPLCRIYNLKGEPMKCTGCYLSSNKDGYGCGEFKSYDKLIKFVHKRFPLKTFGTHTLLSGWHVGIILSDINLFYRIQFRYLLNKCIRLLRKHKKILYKFPEERFTVSGWEYSGNEISREDCG